MDERKHPARKHYHLKFESRKPGSWRQVDTAEEATHAIILIRHREHATELTFEMGETEQSRRNALYQRSQVERLIELAYDRGDDDGRADIRRALRIR